MATTQDETIAELQRTIAELRQERDDRTSATRDSEYGERIEHQAATIDVLKECRPRPAIRSRCSI